MRSPTLSTSLVVVVLACAQSAFAHFPILLPDRASARPDEPVRIRFEFGHPFEREMIAVTKPRSIEVVPPRGERTRPEVHREDAEAGPDGRGEGDRPREQAPEREGAPSERSAGEGTRSPPVLESEPARRWACSYVPQERGDHLVLAEAAPRYEENADEVVLDLVKTTVHVMSQNGWDRAVGQTLEIVPLTRPYGIRPGWTFRFKVLLEGAPAPGAAVEVERLNAVPPEPPLPQDEFITRTSRTAGDGTGLATLDEAGWWGISVVVPHGTAQAPDGHTCPRVIRSTLWVYVGEPL